MNKRDIKQQSPNFPSATNPGPKPGDFPLGSLKSRAAARAIVDRAIAEEQKIEQAEFGKLTPLELALSNGYSGYKKRLAIGSAQVIQERTKIFQFATLTPEEFRHMFAVAREIDRMTNGRGGYLRRNEPEEWERLRAIAESNLGGAKC